MDRVMGIGDRRELFVDRALIDRMDGVALRLHEPVSGGVAIRIDRPWEGPSNAPVAVFRHGGVCLMYYIGRTLEENNGRLCVAVSADGATWTKPALGLVASGGGDTNIVADERGSGFRATPWLDTRPDVPATERIKAIASQPLSGEAHTAFKDPAGPKRLVFWGSADGFSFRKLDPQPEMVCNLRNCFDGGNTMFWSDAEEQYVLYYRWLDGVWGKGYRSIARTTSKDLMHWTPSVPMTYGGTPCEHLYTNNTAPYFRAPHLYLAPAARFMEGRRVVTDEDVAAIGLRMSHGHFYGNDCSDAVLLTSRAGSTQYDRTFMETFIRPGPSPANWTSRTNYPVTGILPAGPGQIMLFVARHYMQDTWHIERLLLRTDGFASVKAPWAGGEMLTKTLTFSGGSLEINYRTGAPGSVRIEIQDAVGEAIPGYALDDSREMIGDETARLAAWKHGADVSRLAGQPVRLRFAMKDADLFSFRFRSESGR